MVGGRLTLGRVCSAPGWIDGDWGLLGVWVSTEESAPNNAGSGPPLCTLRIPFSSGPEREREREQRGRLSRGGYRDGAPSHFWQLPGRNERQPMRDPRPAAAALVALLAGRGTGRSMGAGPIDGARPHGPDGGPLGEETFRAPRRRRLALHRRHAIRATTGEGGEEEVDEVDDGEGSPARRDLADSSDAGNLDSDNEHSDSDDDEEECAWRAPPRFERSCTE